MHNIVLAEVMDTSS